MERQDNYIKSNVIYNKKIYDNVYKIKLEGKFSAKPGQFYMLRAWGNYPLLSRPISVYDVEDDGISFLYLVTGKGTEIFAGLKKGDTLETLGALGNGFELDKTKKAAVITGGIGIAPMLFLAKKLEKQNVDLYAGFRDKSYAVSEFLPYVNSIALASETGAEGTKGNVLNIFKDKGYDIVYACGPTPMLQALKQNIDNEKLYLSLERHMACGIGACLGCTVSTTKGMQRVCHDGPVFLAKELINA